MSEAAFAEVPEHLLDEAQRAARALLAHGLVTPHHPDEATFRRVRRWAPQLAVALDELAGWMVHDTRQAVRLERRSDVVDDTPWWPIPGVLPDRQLLALFCLVLAALERADDQILLSDLSGSVRLAAGRAHMSFDPAAHADRRALCAALKAIERLGGVSVRDGEVDAWRDGQGAAEALLDVDRDALRLLFLPPRGLQSVESAADLLLQPEDQIGRDASRHRRRQRVIRRLLDRPVVYLDDLDEADRVWLRQEAASVARDVERLTGGVLERRAEGAALVYRERPDHAQTFPITGSDTVAALALASDLCRALVDPATPREACPHASVSPPVRPGTAPSPPPPSRPAPFVSDATLREHALRHTARLGETVRADLRTPDAFCRAAVHQLAAFDLVRVVPGGICLLPALARFREAVIMPLFAGLP